MKHVTVTPHHCAETCSHQVRARVSSLAVVASLLVAGAASASTLLPRSTPAEHQVHARALRSGTW
jgi:hypothetical protein